MLCMKRRTVEMKQRLEQEPGFKNTVRDCPRKVDSELTGDAEQQQRLHAAAAQCLGVLDGEDPGRSEKVRELLCKRLREMRG